MDENQVLAAYAAYSLNDSERLSSSSGGMFSLLAKVILADGGVIYGVAMSIDCRRAEYIRVTEEKELTRLQTSKYMQAHMGMSFKQVKEDLKNGISVLFTGTGCQINGLVGFLSANKTAVEDGYPNLYCMDVVCHGAPSPALWDKYVNYVEGKNNAKLVSVNFRCKDKRYLTFGMKEFDEQHKEYFISKDQDPFMRMFLRDYCLRPSCYECKAKEKKMSDITLADFWGIEKVAPAMSDGNGTSLILIRSERGIELLDKIRSQIRIKQVSYEDGISYNPAEYESVARPKEREFFFHDMEELSFDNLKDKYATPIPLSFKKKIKSKVKRVLIKFGIMKDNDISYYGLRFVFDLKKTDKE